MYVLIHVIWFRKGTKFHECRGKHFSEAYVEGDTLGFLITLPESSKVNHIPHTYKDRVIIYIYIFFFNSYLIL